MKRLVLLVVIIHIAVGLMVAVAALGAKSDQKKSATSTSAPATTQAAGKPINKFCAVDHDDPVDPKTPTVTYKGKVIGFCCEDCIPKFKKDPEKYMKTLK
jgi:YHS domain-containing protein